ncbi:PIG-M-domain-containing protein [Gongronella butleri]|nr:PIG-M-domain-containing protein [Gongronella butleri]
MVLSSAASSSSQGGRSKGTRFTFSHLLVLSVVLRAVLLIYGAWQDAHMTVKYTDIDYVVFTDAARFVVAGGSPYERETYRYTPLLAFVLVPNIVWFEAFGKVVFALADIAVGYLMHRMLVLRGLGCQRALWFDALWLLNPMVANISTRGSAESLLALMVLGTLYLLVTRQFYPACAAFGLAVHFKIYPVIYAAPFLFLLDNDHFGDPIHDWPAPILSYKHYRAAILQRLAPSSQNEASDAPSLPVWKRAAHAAILFVSPTRLMFALCSAASFFLLSWWMYQLYGDEFLQHTYLYHVGRMDHRHNFSVWFYQMYLGFEDRWIGLVAFVPQMLLVAVAGIVFAKDVFFACFIQTFLFVTFNKVCTSQYFMWYICLFPLILPSTAIQLKWHGLALILFWVVGQALWLQSAYQLEFLGQNTFFSLWMASIVFFIINGWIAVSLIANHQFERVFGKHGRIRWVWGLGDLHPDPVPGASSSSSSLRAKR